MADNADRAQIEGDDIHEKNIAAVRSAAANIPEGVPGDCELCAEWSGRLVGGVCAVCRDKWGLP